MVILVTLNVKISPLFQILWAFLMEAQKKGIKVRRSSQSLNLIHIEEDMKY